MLSVIEKRGCGEGLLRVKEIEADLRVLRNR